MPIVNVLELSPLLCNCPFSSVVLYSLRSVQSWLVTEMSRNWLNSRGWFSNAIGSQMKWNQRGNEVATCYAWTIIGRVAFGRRNVKFSLLSRQLVDWWSRCRGHGSEVRCGSSAHIHIKWFAFVLATGHWNALKTGAHRGRARCVLVARHGPDPFHMAFLLLRRGIVKMFFDSSCLSFFHSFTHDVLAVHLTRFTRTKCFWIY